MPLNAKCKQKEGIIKTNCCISRDFTTIFFKEFKIKQLLLIYVFVILALQQTVLIFIIYFIYFTVSKAGSW